MCIPLGGGIEVDGDADDCGEYFVFWLPFACVCTFRAKQFLLLFLWLLVFRFRLGLNILLQAIAARMKWERNVLRSRRWQPAFVVQWRASNEMPQTNTMNICTNLIRQSIVCFCQVGHDTRWTHTFNTLRPSINQQKSRMTNVDCWTGNAYDNSYFRARIKKERREQRRFFSLRWMDECEVQRMASHNGRRETGALNWKYTAYNTFGPNRLHTFAFVKLIYASMHLAWTRPTNRWSDTTDCLVRLANAGRVQLPYCIVWANGRLAQRMRHLWPSLFDNIHLAHHLTTTTTPHEKSLVDSIEYLCWLNTLNTQKMRLETSMKQIYWQNHAYLNIPRTQSHDDIDSSKQLQNTLPLSAISIPSDSCVNDDARQYVERVQINANSIQRSFSVSTFCAGPSTALRYRVWLWPKFSVSIMHACNASTSVRLFERTTITWSGLLQMRKNNISRSLRRRRDRIIMFVFIFNRFLWLAFRLWRFCDVFCHTQNSLRQNFRVRFYRVSVIDKTNPILVRVSLSVSEPFVESQ